MDLDLTSSGVNWNMDIDGFASHVNLNPSDVISLTITAALAIYVFYDRIKNNVNRNTKTAMDLLCSIKVYSEKSKVLRDHLNQKGTQEGQKKRVQTMLLCMKRDADLMYKCKSILAKHEDSQKKTMAARIHDAMTDNERTELANAKLQIDESIRNLAFYMIFEDFERRLNDQPVNKFLTSFEAKNYWISRIGPKIESIDIDTFTRAYQDFLIESHGWDGSKVGEIISFQVLRNVVGSTIDIGSNPDEISLAEFDNFTKRFKPLSRSFLKMASLCDKQGFLLPWFAPVEKLSGTRWQLDYPRKKWVLRLSGKVENFTLQIAKSATDERGLRIALDSDGMYHIEVPNSTDEPRLYDSLAELVHEEIPRIIGDPEEIRHHLTYWRRVEAGTITDDHSESEQYVSSEPMSPRLRNSTKLPQDEAALLEEQLTSIERRIEALAQALGIEL